MLQREDVFDETPQADELTMVLDDLEQLINSHRFPIHSDLALHDALEYTIRKNRVDYELLREFRHSGTIRFIFWLPQFGIPIEIKIDASASAVMRQLHRYATWPNVNAILLVTTRVRHVALIREADSLGKPLRIVSLASSIV